MIADNTQSQVRFATFNVALNRNSGGELVNDLATSENNQAKGIAEIIQRTNADILLLNEFDYDANGDAINNFKSNYLEISQNGVDPVEYPYVYFAPVNTGVASGFDLNNDGNVGSTEGTFELANDAFGFGTFPGQYGMVLLSKYPIESQGIRTFQNFLWKDMPNGFLSDDRSVDEPSTEVNENLNGYYSAEEIEVLRLSSKSHWDVPINVNGEVVHVLVSHPTPPVFDGEEDRNGKRNHDEIRFWSDYVTPGNGDYIYDDNGTTGGLNSGKKFVIMGDQNADPNDGDSTDNAILQLLDNSQINTNVTPESKGGVEAAQIQGGINATHTGNPAFDTGDFNDENPGNLRVDYVLPSKNLNITDAQVFWSETYRGFDDLVVFGDSYSDTGNVFNASGQLFPPSPPYFQGRLSNGPLWVDILAQELSLEEDDIQNFAFGGATSDRSIFIPPSFDLDPNIGSQFPGLLDQIDQFSATTGGNGADPNDLYFVWVNGNDFQDVDFNNLGEVQTAATSFVGNISTAVTSLTNLGAEKIAVPNIINFGLLPQNIDADFAEEATTGAVAINQLLTTSLSNLEQTLGVDIIEIDTFGLTQEIATSPGDFGFSNITDPLIEQVNPTNPDEFLFFDDTHFTTQTHEIIADEFIDALGIEPSFADIEASSDHRLVYVDVEVTGENPPPVTDEVGRKNVSGIEFLGEVDFNTGLEFQGTEVGGLSGITYDAENKVYYAISDDRSSNNPARYYTLSIDLDDGKLDDGDIKFDKVTTLLDKNGNPFPESSVDPEGIALDDEGNLYISSEGDADNLINPFVNKFSLDGKQISELPIPEKYLPTANNSSGIRNNLSLESVTITPDQRFLYTATENALNQDGSASDIDSESLSRIIKYDLTTGEVVGEFVYPVEKVPEEPTPNDGFRTNGLVELLAIDDDGTLLALERAFSVGKGNTVKLYEIKTQGALNVSQENDLFNEADNVPFEIDPTVTKREILDVSDLGVIPDNLEGITFGSQLPDGRQSLIVVSDNNFNATQKTQFLAFGLNLDTTPVITPKVETPEVVDIKDAQNAIPGDSDDPAIWVNPNNPSDSLVIGTLKDGGLATFNLAGELKQRILPSQSSNPLDQTLGEYGSVRYNNVDIIYDFQAAGFTPTGTFTTDLVVVSDRENDSLAFFTINPETGELFEFATSTYNPSESIFGDNPTIFGVDDGEQTAYGLTTYTSPTSGKSYVFVTQADGNKVAQIELIPQVGPADEPFIDGKIVRMLELPVPTGNPQDSQAEGLAVDKELGILYVAMESEVGILKFGAEPDSGNDFSIIQSKFDNIVTFGDSLADVGNAFNATNQSIPPSPPYFEGRLSNGLLGVELFAQQLGLSASTPAFTNGNNFALGGSEFGSGNDNFGGEPRTGELINLYLSQNTPSSDDIFYIFGGANNFFPNLNTDVTPQEIIANIPDPESVVDLLSGHITTLASAGAKTFVVPNLVPLGNTPFAQFTGTSEQLNTASIAYNDLLDIKLDELENQLENNVDPDIDIVEIDVEKRFDEIKADPGAFRLTNVTDPAFNQQTEEIVPNPSEFFWWDSLHPSAAAYELVSELTIKEFTQQIDLLEDDSESPLVSDIEGLTIYYGADGEGYLIASSQGDSSYAVFSREGNNEYLGSFTIGKNGDIDQVNETDGLDIINVPLGDEYPNGLLVVQDGANDPQVVVQDDEELENVSTNFKFVDLSELVKALPDKIKLDTTSYNPRSTGSDNPDNSGNPPVNNQDLPKLELVNGTLKFSSGTGTVNLKAQLADFDSNTTDEIGFFITKDEIGTITDSGGNTFTPADGDEYIKAALEQSKILFSNLPNLPNGFNNPGIRNLPNFSPGEQLVFYKIEKGSADGVVNGKVSTDQVVLGSDPVEITDLGNEEFSIQFSDASINLTLKSSDETLPIGVSSQVENAELIDLSDITGQVTANFNIYREAAFNNSVYFYKLDDSDGLTGGINPDESGYLQAALDNVIRDIISGEIVEFSSENQGITTGNAIIEGGSILGTMIVADGNYEQLVDADISNDPEVYFSFLGANSDKVDHIHSIATNTLGFEDLVNGGDNDFNDVIIEFDFSV